MKKIILITLLFLTHQSIWAASSVGKVAKIHSPWNSSDGIYIQLDPPLTDSNCASSDWVFLPRSHIGFQEIYAMLLSAYTTDITVTVVSSGCASTSPVYPEFSYMHMAK